MRLPPDVCSDALAPLADPSLRLLGVVIEVAILFSPLLLIPLGMIVGAPLLLRMGAIGCLAANVVLICLNVLWLHRHGQTVGKRLLGLRIVRSDRSPAGIVRLLVLRYVLPLGIGYLPWVGGLFALADPLFMLRADRRAVHDFMADTIVIDVRRPLPAEDAG